MYLRQPVQEVGFASPAEGLNLIQTLDHTGNQRVYYSTSP